MKTLKSRVIRVIADPGTEALVAQAMRRLLMLDTQDDPLRLRAYHVPDGSYSIERFADMAVIRVSASDNGGALIAFASAPMDGALGLPSNKAAGLYLSGSRLVARALGDDPTALTLKPVVSTRGDQYDTSGAMPAFLTNRGVVWPLAGMTTPMLASPSDALKTNFVPLEFSRTQLAADSVSLAAMSGVSDNSNYRTALAFKMLGGANQSFGVGCSLLWSNNDGVGTPSTSFYDDAGAQQVGSMWATSWLDTTYNAPVSSASGGGNAVLSAEYATTTSSFDDSVANYAQPPTTWTVTGPSDFTVSSIYNGDGGMNGSVCSVTGTWNSTPYTVQYGAFNLSFLVNEFATRVVSLSGVSSVPLRSDSNVALIKTQQGMTPLRSDSTGTASGGQPRSFSAPHSSTRDQIHGTMHVTIDNGTCPPGDYTATLGVGDGNVGFYGWSASLTNDVSGSITFSGSAYGFTASATIAAGGESWTAPWPNSPWEESGEPVFGITASVSPRFVPHHVPKDVLGVPFPDDLLSSFIGVPSALTKLPTMGASLIGGSGIGALLSPVQGQPAATAPQVTAHNPAQLAGLDGYDVQVVTVLPFESPLPTPYYGTYEYTFDRAARNRYVFVLINGSIAYVGFGLSAAVSRVKAGDFLIVSGFFAGPADLASAGGVETLECGTASPPLNVQGVRMTVAHNLKTGKRYGLKLGAKVIPWRGIVKTY